MLEVPSEVAGLLPALVDRGLVMPIAAVLPPPRRLLFVATGLGGLWPGLALASVCLRTGGDWVALSRQAWSLREPGGQCRLPKTVMPACPARMRCQTYLPLRSAQGDPAYVAVAVRRPRSSETPLLVCNRCSAVFRTRSRSWVQGSAAL